MEPVYAVGDIHGHIGQLERVLDLIEADGGRDAQVVFVGDYVDRGPDSRAVLQCLIDGQAAGRRWTTLLGNHDRMFMWFLEDHPKQDPHLTLRHSWLHADLGGRATLASYGVAAHDGVRLSAVHADALCAVPDAHVAFLRALPLVWQTDTLFFCHAGIRPEVPLNQQAENDLVWIRKPFVTHSGSHPKLIVYGHTPGPAVVHHGNRVALDTGAGYGEPLGVALFEGGEVFELTPNGRVPVARG